MIRFDAVTKHFFPETSGVFDVTFSIEPGEFVFITGRSGSGKTTLMRLLTGEYRPSSGEIFFLDLPLSKIKTSKLHLHRRHIGVVFQDYRLLSELTIGENIGLPLIIAGVPKAEHAQRIQDVAKLVGVQDKLNLFPSQLSGGESQRVALARALATGPQVIFADEPTGNLDPETALEIAQLIEKIHSLGTTVLFATHSSELLNQFPKYRRIQVDQGRIATDTAASRRKTQEKETKETKTTKESKPNTKTSPKKDSKKTTG